MEEKQKTETRIIDELLREIESPEFKIAAEAFVLEVTNGPYAKLLDAYQRDPKCHNPADIQVALASANAICGLALIRYLLETQPTIAERAHVASIMCSFMSVLADTNSRLVFRVLLWEIAHGKADSSNEPETRH